MKYGLKEATIELINGVFAKYSVIEEVIIYGSRVKGSYKNGSDIDLVLKGKYIDLALVNRLSNDLDDLLLPYSIDILVYDNIDNNDLLEHIDRFGLVFYKRDGIKEFGGFNEDNYKNE